MKKILFCLICVLTCFSIVSAKTQIEYDWGKYVPYDRYASVDLIDGNLGTVVYDIYEEDFSYHLYDDKGKVIFDESNFDSNAIIVNDQVIYVYYDGSRRSFYQRIYDKNLNFIREVEVSDDFYYSVTDEAYIYNGVTDKYYYIFNHVFDRATNVEVDVWEYAENHDLFDEFLEYNDAGEYQKADEVLFNIFKDDFSGTGLLIDFFVYSTVSYDYDIVDCTFDENGNFAVVLYNYYDDEVIINVYNSDYELLYFLKPQLNNLPQVFFRDDKLYFVEFRNTRERSNIDEEEKYNIVMFEYDLEGNIIDQFELGNIVENSCYDSRACYFNRHLYDVISTNDGFYLLTQKPEQRVETMDPSLNEGDTIYDIDLTIQKFSFVYDVKTKESENGIIKVDKDSSKNGDKITYTVEPKEGYKLDKVIVTDENGNTIEIKDSSFTMPSANVTIEAIFVVENPNTGVFINVGCACIVALISYYYIVQKNIRVKQYE